MTNKTKLPPGQQLVAANKWPIIGEREPPATDGPHKLTISGSDESSHELSIDDLNSLKQTTKVIDIHCVTRWSKLGVEFSGVLLSDLLASCGVNVDANFISFVSRSSRKHSSSLSLAKAIELETLIALTVDGQKIPDEHGGPIRNIVPNLYFYKSVKWLSEIKLLEQDELGYWESDAGYHNLADPWLEQRYMAANVDRRTAGKLIQTRNFSGHDLRSIDVSNMDLQGLDAKSASLRDANFRNTDLAGSDFTDANLSNAHFQSANLSGCKFIRADLEGANLAGADLRGADLTECSLIGSTFYELDSAGETTNPAKLNSQTTVPSSILSPLTPSQRAFIKDALKQS